MNAQVLDSGGSLGVGATEAVRVISNTRTSGEVQLKATRPETNQKAQAEITIQNAIGSPMVFYLDYYPKNLIAGRTLAISTQNTTLPEGVRPSELVFQWYKDGVLLESGGSATYTTVAQNGVHRYDVIIKSNKEGTMCSASLVLNVSN